jgi:hypothetical protein
MERNTVFSLALAIPPENKKQSEVFFRGHNTDGTPVRQSPLRTILFIQRYGSLIMTTGRILLRSIAMSELGYLSLKSECLPHITLGCHPLRSLNSGIVKSGMYCSSSRFFKSVCAIALVPVLYIPAIRIPPRCWSWTEMLRASRAARYSAQRSSPSNTGSSPYKYVTSSREGILSSCTADGAVSLFGWSDS